MSRFMVSFLFVLLQFLSLFVQSQSGETKTPPTTEFAFQGFSENKSEIQTEGAAIITPDGLLRLTDQNLNVTGTAFYRKPVRLLNQSNLNLSTKAEVCSFSTSFLFIIVPSSSSNGGFGFTFTLSPTPNRPGAESGQYLGLLNDKNDGNQLNHVFAVEFDTVQVFKDGSDSSGNLIGLNFNNVTSDVQEPVVYTSDEGRREDFQYETEPIRVRLDYNGPTQLLNLIVFPAKFTIGPSTPLISQRVPKLLEIVQEEMYVGFTASTGEDMASAHYLMGWSFRSCRDGLAADSVALRDFPSLQLNKKKKGNQSMVTKILIGSRRSECAPPSFPDGILVCKADAAWDATTGRCGVGGIFSGVDCHVLPKMTEGFSHVTSALMAEALAVHRAVSLACLLKRPISGGSYGFPFSDQFVEIGRAST